MMRRVAAWLDERTGARGALERWFGFSMEGGASPRHSPLFAIAFVFGVVALTGALLSLHYSPGVASAWASVWFIEQRLTLGWLIRGVHHTAASALLILIVLHLVELFVHRGYEAPRELRWLLALAAMGLTLATLATGNLLPWDQTGYWAAHVETSIAGSMPVVGPLLVRLARGGAELGNLTLTRFYGLHAIVLPAILALLIAAMWRARARTATEGPPAETKGDRYWPNQLLFDGTVALVVLAVIIAVAATVSTPLDAPADPGGPFDARPEWYFYPLFTLRGLMEGPLVLVGTAVIPGVATAFLVLLPFVDRKGGDRRLRARRLWSGLLLGGLLATAALGAWGMKRDRANDGYQEQQETARVHAAEALRYAAVEPWGIDETGRIVLFEGKQVFRRERCTECHEVDGEGSEDGPSMTGYLSRAWIRRFLENPDDPKHFGGTELEGMMPEPGIEGPELDALVEYVASLSGGPYTPGLDHARVAKGAKVFVDSECGACHPAGDKPGDGPNLKGYGSAEWLVGLLRNPSSPAHYGENGGGMPTFGHLTRSERDYLIAWLLQLKSDAL